MPRKARIDAPGAIHHIICSDIEHREREIFRDDTDRDSFIERFERRYRLQMHGLDVDKVVDRVTEIFNLKTEEVLTSGKQPQRVKARSLLCYWVVKELGLSGAYMARRLKISKISCQPRDSARRKDCHRYEVEANRQRESHKINPVLLFPDRKRNFAFG